LYYTNTLTKGTFTKLDHACRIVFGPLFHLTPATFNYLKESGIKSAYREKAKVMHPDMSVMTGEREDVLSERFKELNGAYNILLELLPKLPIKCSYHAGTTRKKEPENERSYSYYHKKDFYFIGHIPKRTLRFAEFLYYKKIISWNALINSLVWQYRERPKVGQIFKESDILSDEEILSIIRDIKPSERFGSAALRKGYITKEELQAVLNAQARFNLPIGKYFTKNSMIKETDVFKHLFENKIHNSSITK
jgi:hypothetical protein